jgi:hypothetical protein
LDLDDLSDKDLSISLESHTYGGLAKRVQLHRKTQVAIVWSRTRSLVGDAAAFCAQIRCSCVAADHNAFVKMKCY